MATKILIGDCREKLRELPDASVNCCVTSPPYFGLRDYGTAQWEGGSADCDHKQTTARKDGGRANIGAFNGSSASNSDKGAMNYREVCGKCGATRVDRQMGLEPTPDEFVAGMVEVFQEVKRVLRDDGTLWLNIGDSYASGRGESQGVDPKQGARRFGKRPQDGKIPDCKNKDLIGIPWMLAFALRADGWYLRQDIIWSKPNPMPESVRDRCTKAHEYLFLLSKGPRYYYDADAIAEKSIHAGAVVTNNDGKNGQMGKFGATRGGFLKDGGVKVGETRNKRSVWEVAAQPFSEAHFATYPPALIEPCILAGCPKGGTVLDPFFGAGTTGLVADRLGRNCIGVELNPEYAAIAQRRLEADSPLFAKVEAA
jgi:DNA modification methylase